MANSQPRKLKVRPQAAKAIVQELKKNPPPKKPIQKTQEACSMGSNQKLHQK